MSRTIFFLNAILPWSGLSCREAGGASLTSLREGTVAQSQPDRRAGAGGRDVHDEKRARQGAGTGACPVARRATGSPPLQPARQPLPGPAQRYRSGECFSEGYCPQREHVGLVFYSGGTLRKEQSL